LLFDSDGENNKKSINYFSYLKNKEEKIDLQEVKKNTIKLFYESKISPFDKLAEIDKYRLRLKSSEGMKKIMDLKDNNLKEENKIKKTKNKISSKTIFYQTNDENKIRKPFELEKENLDLVLFNEKNRKEFYQEQRKIKSSQIKFRKKISLHEKIQNGLEKKTDILSLFYNDSQKEFPLKKTSLNSISYKLNNKLKIMINNYNLLENLPNSNKFVIKNAYNKSNNLSDNPKNFIENKDNLNVNEDYKDTDIMQINYEDLLNNGKNDKKELKKIIGTEW